MAGTTAQVFLIHGSDPVRVHQERTRLIGAFLPREHRAENLTEIEPPGNRLLQLRQIAADLMGELATPSFFPDVARVIVVEQLGDLFGAGKSSRGRRGATAKSGKAAKKASPDEEAVAALCRFLERDLPLGNNILILTAIEDPDKRRRVQTTSALYKALRTLGTVTEFKQTASIFRLIDAFTMRDLATSLRVLPEVLSQGDGAGSVLRMLTRQVRFLIQAKLLERFGASGDQAKEFATKHFPPDKGLNLLLQHSFSISKVRKAAPRWSLSDLNALLPKLERLSKVVYPSLKDVYVPDPHMELERLVLESLSSTGQLATKR